MSIESGISPDEHVELTQLYALYNYAVDDFDAALAVSLFTADGAFRRTNSTVAFPGARNWVGSGELMDYFGARRPLELARQHWVNIVQFTRTRFDAVEGRASFSIVEEGGGVVALGSYRDEIVRSTGSWRFKNRYVTFL